jgi:hypothetical protein
MAFITALASAAATYIGVTSTIGVLLVRTAVTALVTYAFSKTMGRQQQQTGVDTGVRQTLDTATTHKIPVIYGSAHMGGIITDGILANDNKTMWMCLTISEKTGRLFSTGAAPVYTFNTAYRNTNQVTFQADGVTIDRVTDSDGNQDSSMQGLIKVYMYAGGGAAANQISPTGFSVSPQNAWDLFPGWTISNNMTDLIFALIRVEYNRDKNVTSLGQFQFNIANRMTDAGDVLFDYATNTRYGAGIRLPEINTGEANSTTITRMGLTTYPWINLS